MSKRHWSLTIGAGLLAIAVPNRTVLALSYYGEYMNNWSGCLDSTPSSLSYTDDQVNQFAGAMDTFNSGNSRRALWGNMDVWRSDITDSWYGGDDTTEADMADIYVLSSHGDAPNDGTGDQTFVSPYCAAGASLSGSWFDANQGIFGEGGGTHKYLRWAIFLTCRSVDVHPEKQWDSAFSYTGFEYIMGYRGLSADSPTTDEVAGDWADDAIVWDHAAFKATWFSAIEDFWVDDTGALMSGGTTASDANNRRDNLTRLWTRRTASTNWPYLATSWYEG